MDCKTRLLRFGCVVASLEVAVMAASLVTSTMATPNDSPDLYRASLWLMLFHNVLEICFYGVLASLLAADNRPFAIAGFVSGLIGLLAFSCSILIEIKSSLGRSFRFWLRGNRCLMRNHRLVFDIAGQRLFRTSCTSSPPEASGCAGDLVRRYSGWPGKPFYPGPSYWVATVLG